MLQSQTKLHPDRYGNEGERVVSLARELSGRVNEAYSTLADPLKRAEYIVSCVAVVEGRQGFGAGVSLIWNISGWFAEHRIIHG